MFSPEALCQEPRNSILLGSSPPEELCQELIRGHSGTVSVTQDFLANFHQKGTQELFQEVMKF